jgi:hypothetical protein
MNTILSLLMGDPSGDGHGQTGTLLLLSNLSAKEVEKAYKKGAKKLGIDVRKDVAAQFEDRTISASDLQKFKDAGMAWEGDADFLWTDSYAKLFLFTVKVGDPTFEYQEVKDATVEIGGYGLFSM